MYNMFIEDESDHNLPSILKPMHVENTNQNLHFEGYLQGQVEFQ